MSACDIGGGNSWRTFVGGGSTRNTASTVVRCSQITSPSGSR